MLATDGLYSHNLF